MDFIPLHSLQSDIKNDFEGRASTSRSAQLVARMTVTVAGKKVNGDLIVEGARLSAKAGFDFVDIKQCHRYLLSELLAASGQEHPEEMTRDDIYHRVGSSKILRFDELYPPLEVGCIVNGNTPPEYQRYVDAASAETFATNFRNGRPRDASGGTFTIE